MLPSDCTPAASGRDGPSPRCLVVDDSPEVVSEIQHQVSRLVPRAIFLPPAKDGGEALRRIRDYRPEILFLDLGMPMMSGLTTLRALAGERPARTIVLAPETRDGGRAAWEALGLGATDFLPKRGIKGRTSINMTASDLADRLRVLLGPLAAPWGDRIVRMQTRPAEPAELDALAALIVLIETRRLIATARRLSRLCVELPIPLLLDVPHPSRFTPAIAEGLDRMTRSPVRVAVSGERLAPGHIFLIPAGHHAFLRGRRGEVDLQLAPCPPRSLEAHHHRRSIRALLDPEGSTGGIALTSRPSHAAIAPAFRVAGEGRLFRLVTREDPAETTLLRTIDRLALRRTARAA